MRQLHLLILLTLLMIMLGASSVAQPFVSTYNFDQVTTASGTTDPTPPPTAAGVSFGSFTAVGYTGSPGAGGRFSWNANPVGGTNGVDDFSQFTGSLTTTAYFEVAITPLSLIQMQLDSITFTLHRSGTGIRSYAVRSSLDGYAANLAASIFPATANLGIGPGNEFRVLSDVTITAQAGSTVTLGAPFSGLTSMVKFRFYGWNAESSAGTFSVDNVAFSGRTDSIPEPSVVALLLGGLAMIGIGKRHNKQPRSPDSMPRQK